MQVHVIPVYVIFIFMYNVICSASNTLISSIAPIVL